MNPGELRYKVIFQKMDIETEVWSLYYSCYAKINTAGGSKYFMANVEQSSGNTVFTVRYCDALKGIYLNAQIYRILFEDGTFDVKAVDDYMFSHTYLNIKTVGKETR